MWTARSHPNASDSRYGHNGLIQTHNINMLSAAVTVIFFLDFVAGLYTKNKEERFNISRMAKK